ncbi:Virulence protein [Limihaloglobus sulfuriphilus]|uniref:Virulence protein n=1 Tax=Limihaloglobus sulfuriphilus TaxID=1851148 RepID=A0A1Q2MBY5_9BACT|nr:hypothetical protein [Limihaloglobus sulfuriphilus]AQQ69752.1 Virulence protein [Limihaloglobus sulfuriphilus]
MPEKDLITKQSQNIIIYTSPDGKASVALYAKDGTVWMNQKQIAELFATSVPNVSMHISNIFKKLELDENSVIKDYLTTADDGIRHQSRDSNGAVRLDAELGIRQ